MRQVATFDEYIVENRPRDTAEIDDGRRLIEKYQADIERLENKIRSPSTTADFIDKREKIILEKLTHDDKHK